MLKNKTVPNQAKSLGVYTIATNQRSQVIELLPIYTRAPVPTVMFDHVLSAKLLN